MRRDNFRAVFARMYSRVRIGKNAIYIYIYTHIYLFIYLHVKLNIYLITLVKTN